MRVDDDAAVRLAAIQFLDTIPRTADSRWPTVSWELMTRGFEHKGQRITLAGTPGIWKPLSLDLPLSIRTRPHREGEPPLYDDDFREDEGYVTYRYQSLGADRHDNQGMRRAVDEGVPLIYFYGILPGRYLAIYPAFLIADDPALGAVHVEFSAAPKASRSPSEIVQEELQRRYVLREVKRRIHQDGFRLRVLDAYHSRCAICRLRHPELLDGAHIVPDGHPLGRPVVANGLALCKLHHAAFDAHILGINPHDLRVEVRADILEEIDGPMLDHGLKRTSGVRLTAPSRPPNRPAAEYLEHRYEMFRRAS
jgi:putative restriction endonuclease